jgi:hypothetical protein
VSAETLRRAATQMRKRAEDATSGPWEVMRSSADHIGFREESGFFSMLKEGTWGTKADCEYVASWHPAVALAVADWLDAEALAADEDDTGVHTAALAVARAYLGESA